MIGFQLSNGDVITLDAKAKVEFELVSSLFDDDIPGAHSTNIQVPDVNGNFKKLGFVNRFDILQRTIQHDDVRMLIDGRPEYTGKLFVRRKNKTGLSCFYVPNGFAVDIQDAMLQDVNYGSTVNLGSNTAAVVAAATAYVAQDYPAVNFNFPSMYAPKAYSIEDARAWRCIDNTDALDLDTDYIVNEYVSGDINGVGGLARLYRCIINAAAGETPFTAPSKWQEENGNCVVNNWDPSAIAFHFNTIDGLETFNKHSLSPQLFGKFILNRIGATYGHQIIGEFMDDETTDQWMVHNNVMLDRGERQFFTRSEQDGVYDGALNPNAGSGVQIVTVASNELVFNDEVTAPNEDADGILTQAGTATQYIIQNAGEHTFTFQLNFSTNTSTAFTKLVLRLPYSGATPNIGDALAFIPTAYTGVFEYTYTYDALPADVGEYIQVEIYYLSGAQYIAMDAGSFLIVENNAANNMNRYKGDVVLNQHVPDVTVADFLIGVKRRFNLNVIIDNRAKIIRLDYAKNVLAREADDYSNILQLSTFDFKDPEGLAITEKFNAGIDVTDGEGLAITDTVGALVDIDTAALAAYRIGDIVYSRSDNKLYRVVPIASIYKGVVPINNYYPELVYGDGKRTLEMIGHPANMESLVHEGDVPVLPRFDFEFSSDLFGMGRKDCPLIFSFWRGLKYGQQGAQQFPFASPHPYEPDGTAITNAIDLRFYDAAISIWQEQHADFVRKADRTLTLFADANMNLKDVFQWDFRKPIRSRNDLMLRSKLIYQIDQDGNVDAEVHAVKITP
jgi:hypothetical protein